MTTGSETNLPTTSNAIWVSDIDFKVREQNTKNHCFKDKIMDNDILRKIKLGISLSDYLSLFSVAI